MHLRAKLKVGGAIIPILVFMAPPEEESWIRTKYDGHLIVLDATAEYVICQSVINGSSIISLITRLVNFDYFVDIMNV
jgi:hypothetical protein